MNTDRFAPFKRHEDNAILFSDPSFETGITGKLTSRAICRIFDPLIDPRELKGRCQVEYRRGNKLQNLVAISGTRLKCDVTPRVPAHVYP